MNNQKDNQRTLISHYGQAGFYENKALLHKPDYDFAHKKTEKLITALYMVTDCMEHEDALRTKLRSLGVELLSDIHRLGLTTPKEGHSHTSLSRGKIVELISFLEITQTMGFISEMNGIILKKEFGLLSRELEIYENKDKHFSFTLDTKMFEVERNQTPENSTQFGIKDKRTYPNTMSFINKKSPIQNIESKSNVYSVSTLTDRGDRTTKILELIKDKQRLSKSGGVSIKDISNSFPHVSEKTIQRELNSLVEKGKIKKEGSKRWSRYQVGQ